MTFIIKFKCTISISIAGMGNVTYKIIIIMTYINVEIQVHANTDTRNHLISKFSTHKYGVTNIGWEGDKIVVSNT